MDTDRQPFGHCGSTARAVLGGATREYLQKRAASLCRFAARVLEELAPGRISHALVERPMPVGLHVLNVQIFANDDLPEMVDDPEHRWRSQEGLCPVLMGHEKAKEPGPLREAGKQHPIVSRQPAIERAVAHAFDRMQEPSGDHLTGPEAGVGMCGHVPQLLIDLAEQRDDTILRGHAALLQQ